MMLMMRRISLRWDGVAVGDLGHVIEPPYLALRGLIHSPRLS